MGGEFLTFIGYFVLSTALIVGSLVVAIIVAMAPSNGRFNFRGYVYLISTILLLYVGWDFLLSSTTPSCTG